MNHNKSMYIDKAQQLHMYIACSLVSFNWLMGTVIKQLVMCIVDACWHIQYSICISHNFTYLYAHVCTNHHISIWDHMIYYMEKHKVGSWWECLQVYLMLIEQHVRLNLEYGSKPKELGRIWKLTATPLPSQPNYATAKHRIDVILCSWSTHNFNLQGASDGWTMGMPLLMPTLQGYPYWCVDTCLETSISGLSCNHVYSMQAWSDKCP